MAKNRAKYFIKYLGQKEQFQVSHMRFFSLYIPCLFPLSWVKTIKIRLELRGENRKRWESRDNSDINSLGRAPAAQSGPHEIWSDFIQIHRTQSSAATQTGRGQELTVVFLMSALWEIQNWTFIPWEEMHKLKVCSNWKLATHCQRKTCDERC